MLVIFNVIFIAFIGGIVIFIRSYRQRKREYEQELETVDLQHKKELLTTQMEIQTQTMKSIGQELHDNVGQKLTLSSLYLQQLPEAKNKTETKEAVERINAILNESLEDLRQLSQSLTKDTIHNQTIEELLQNECDRVNVLGRYKASFNSSIQSIDYPYEIKSVLLRISQEFIQNSIKHAQCKQITISLHEEDKSLQLFLSDDGKGFDSNTISGKGIGLKNVEKRVKLLNGQFDLQSAIGQGTTFNIKIPI